MGLQDKANKNKADKATLIAEIGKATTVGQLKALMIQLVLMLDK